MRSKEAKVQQTEEELRGLKAAQLAELQSLRDARAAETLERGALHDQLRVQVRMMIVRMVLMTRMQAVEAAHKKWREAVARIETEAADKSVAAARARDATAATLRARAELKMRVDDEHALRQQARQRAKDRRYAHHTAGAAIYERALGWRAGCALEAREDGQA